MNVWQSSGIETTSHHAELICMCHGRSGHLPIVTGMLYLPIGTNGSAIISTAEKINVIRIILGE